MTVIQTYQTTKLILHSYFSISYIPDYQIHPNNKSQKLKHPMYGPPKHQNIKYQTYKHWNSIEKAQPK